MVITYTGITNSARQISMNNRIIIAIGEHVIAQQTLAGGDVAVGIEESTPLGVVVTGLEVIEPGFLDYALATEPISPTPAARWIASCHTILPYYSTVQPKSDA